MNRVFQTRFGTNLPQLLKNKKLFYKVDMTFLKNKHRTKYSPFHWSVNMELNYGVSQKAANLNKFKHNLVLSSSSSSSSSSLLFLFDRTFASYSQRKRGRVFFPNVHF